MAKALGNAIYEIGQFKTVTILEEMASTVCGAGAHWKRSVLHIKAAHYIYHEKSVHANRAGHYIY